MEDNTRKRGRPRGYVMSDISKKKISMKLKNRVLSMEHRHKISVAMMGNTNRSKKNSSIFLDDMYNDYVVEYSEEDLGQWISSVRDELLSCSGIFSNRKLSSYSFMELGVDDMDQFSGDFVDPESLLIVKETLKEMGWSMKEYMNG